MSSPGPLSSGRRAVWTTLVQAETFTCVCTRPLARQARVRGGEQRGLLSLCHHAPAQCSRSLRIRHSKLVFQVVMKMYLSRGETRTYFISHFVSLIYNFQIFRHMVCEPPSALPLGPTNRCHLLPTLNIKFTELLHCAAPHGLHGVKGIQAPKQDHLQRIKPHVLKTVTSTESGLRA